VIRLLICYWQLMTGAKAQHITVTRCKSPLTVDRHIVRIFWLVAVCACVCVCECVRVCVSVCVSECVCV